MGTFPRITYKPDASVSWSDALAFFDGWIRSGCLRELVVPARDLVALIAASPLSRCLLVHPSTICMSIARDGPGMVYWRLPRVTVQAARGHGLSGGNGMVRLSCLADPRENVIAENGRPPHEVIAEIECLPQDGLEIIRSFIDQSSEGGSGAR